MEKKEPSPISVVWGWAEKYHSKFYGSVVLALSLIHISEPTRH